MNPPRSGTTPLERGTVAPGIIGAPAEDEAAVVTRTTFAASPEEVWKGLLFYEELEGRPPLHLRLFLPVPIRTEGRKSQIGDTARCLYEGGYLLKRVTRAEEGRRYEFEVIEQRLFFAGGLRLSGGGYRLRELEGGGTEVALATRYSSVKRPRWLWGPIEGAVCHLFHRHILGGMRRRIEAG